MSASGKSLGLLDLPDWLLADLAELKPRISGSPDLVLGLLQALSIRGVAAQDASEGAESATLRAVVIPTNSIGQIDTRVLEQETLLASDYLLVHLASGLGADAVPSKVANGAVLISAVGFDGARPLLVYAKPVAAGRLVGMWRDSTAMMAAIAMSDLRAQIAEAGETDARRAVKMTWSVLRDLSERVMHLQAGAGKLMAAEAMAAAAVQKLAAIEALLAEQRRSRLWRLLCVIRMLQAELGNGVRRGARMTWILGLRSLGVKQSIQLRMRHVMQSTPYRKR